MLVAVLQVNAAESGKDALSTSEGSILQRDAAFGPTRGRRSGFVIAQPGLFLPLRILLGGAFGHRFDQLKAVA